MTSLSVSLVPQCQVTPRYFVRNNGAFRSRPRFCGVYLGRRSSSAMPLVQAVNQEFEVKNPARRSVLVATLLVGGLVAVGQSEAAMQKVEGTKRGTQDAVTTAIKEPSRLSAAKSNTVQEGAKINTQASGGTIIGAPKLETPGGAYRSPQSSTKTLSQAGGKKSTPAGILQKRDGASG